MGHTAPVATSSSPNVVVITIDTLRPDHLGCYGDKQIHTPNIDALAADSARFERAYTAVPMTLPSHTVIFTGTYPMLSGVHDFAADKLSPTQPTLTSVLKENGFDQVEIANVNTPQQVVISGPVADIAACQNVFQFDNAMYIPLNTSGAFHSRLMIPSQERFEIYLKRRKLSDPKIPVIANLTARPYPEGAIVEYLSKQIRSTVLWSDTIQHLMSLSDTMEFVEIGHGDVLTKMTAKIRQHTAKAATQASAPAGVAKVDARPDAATGRAGVAATSGDRFALAEQKVAAWNTHHRVGTKAKSLVADYGDLTTRTSAMVLFGHRAAVYMEGYNGYFDLDEIAAV